MSTQFDRPLYGFRYVPTDVGDTLQAIAARELGDASRWPDLIAYNSLVPPFITDDASLAGPGVLLTGQALLVPAPAPIIAPIADVTDVFGSDVELGPNGDMLTDGSDFVVVSGRANLVQAMKNRIATEEGELLFHLLYGSKVRRLVGAVNGPTSGMLAARAVKTALLRDKRVTAVPKATATISGDVINVTAQAQSIAGVPVQVTTTA